MRGEHRLHRRALGQPWWSDFVSSRLKPGALEGQSIGALWRQLEACEQVHANVDAAGLAEDFAKDLGGHAHREKQWSAFVAREAELRVALERAVAQVALRLKHGELPPERFRESWEQLGFAANEGDAGTPADDHLDGLFGILRHTLGEPLLENLSPNMSSRAERISDFLNATHPAPHDVVVDLGSGSGKLALTVAASVDTRVVGLELGASWVKASRASAAFFSLGVRFVQGDVRELDLSEGSIFYLYHPFRGAVAHAMAQRLSNEAKQRKLTLYVGGPHDGFGEFFLEQVRRGELALRERRGEFSQVLVLTAPR